MTFPLGKPILVMLAAAALSGAAVMSRRHARGSDQTIWTFVHARSFRNDPGASGPPSTRPSLLDQYQALSGRSVQVKLIGARALDTRLLSLFMGASDAVDVPDAVEVEIGSVGKYFRPPLSEIGFLPLDSYLDRDGLRGRFLASRLAPWTKDGHLFGLPQDVHPVGLMYRKDLFDAAGLDPSAAQTWPELQETCLAFQRYWQQHGAPERHALELTMAAADYLTILLLQRHINVLDADNTIHLNDPKVAASVAFYAGMAAGAKEIAAEAEPGEMLWAQDLRRGSLCMMFMPDWRSLQMKQLAPDLAGKVALMPLPVFEPGDAPTATWGGTMMAIPKRCPHPEEAWVLVKFLSTSREALDAAHRAGFDTVPPLPEYWHDPLYQARDPFYAGQQAVNAVYVSLAGQIPARYVTPFTTVALEELADVLSRAIHETRAVGTGGLEVKCQKWLDDAADELKRRIAFGTFE